MHILYLHQYFVPPDGAGGTRSYEMARRFVAAGHRVTLLTSSAFFPPSYTFQRRVTTLTIDGIQVVVLRVPYRNQMSYVRRLGAFLAFAVSLLPLLRRTREVDVVLATSTPLTIAVPGVAAARMHRCPLVLEVRDLWPELPIAMGALPHPLLHRAARALERWAYQHAHHIVALSPGMKAGIVRTGPPPERVTVVPNACDLTLFGGPDATGDAFLAAHPALAGGKLFVYTGTLGPVNGVDYLVRLVAAAHRLDPDVRLLIVGDGRERAAVEALARQLGVWERGVWIHPPRPKQAMPAVLAAADVVCSVFIDLPAMRHNAANKFFDALAAGRPVLLNYEGWQADLLREAEAGLIVPVHDAEAAAATVVTWLSDPGRLHRAGQAARTLAHRFDRDRLTQRMLGVLEAAVRG
ncbi:MAG: glycosyltransferase family 4 protein [Bacteroidota bacterium]